MKFKIITLASCLVTLLSYSSFSQQTYVNDEWKLNIGELGQYDYVTTALDNFGNIIHLTNKKIGSNSDSYLNCVNAGGNMAWQQFCSNSPVADDFGVDLIIDAQGNIYICAAKYNGSDYDYLISKSTFSGSLIWEQIFDSSTGGNNSSRDDVPSGITLDAFDNVIVTGTSKGNGINADCLTLKLDNNGVLLWDAVFDYNNKPDIAIDVISDNNNDVFISGSSAQNAVNSDFLVVKYDALTGNQIAFDKHSTAGNGYDLPSEMKIDDSGNIFVLGTARSNTIDKDVQLLAYNNNLQLQWVKNIDDSGKADEGFGIILNQIGQILITGYLTKANNGTSLFVNKYDQGGNEIWSWSKGAHIDTEICKGRSIAVDVNNNIFICGEEDYEGSRGMLTLCLKNDGSRNWTQWHGESASTSYEGRKIQVNGDQVFVTGRVADTTTRIITVKYNTISRELPVAFENGVASHIADEVIIRFDSKFLNLNTIDDRKHSSGHLQDFVDSNVLDAIEQKTGKDWSKNYTFKVHLGATSSDTLSITRLGDTISVSKFWASLIVKTPLEEDPKIMATLLDSGVIGIQYAHFNPLFEPYTIDPLYNNGQKGLWFNPPTPIISIDAPNAWAKETGSSDIKIGVIDHIIDWDEPDFQDDLTGSTKVVDGAEYSFQSGIYHDISWGQFTSYSHGTSVAGIIGAVRNNGVGVAGIAGGDMDAVSPSTGCPLYSLGISDPGGNLAPQDRLVAALLEGSLESTNLFGFGLHTMNMSWGVNATTADFREAVEECWHNHCVLVAARKNTSSVDDNSPNWPACSVDDQVISVMASGSDGQRKIAFTNGEGPWYSGYAWDGTGNTTPCDVDVMAPGVTSLVASVVANQDQSQPAYTQCGINAIGYNCFEGTSAAAPHVTGTVALMLSEHRPSNGWWYNNGLATEDIEHILQKNATFASNYTLENVHGVIRAGNSLDDITPPYFVEHKIYPGYTNSVVSQTPTGNTYLNIDAYGENADLLGYPDGTNFHSFEQFEIEWVIDEIFPTSWEIIDYWQFNAVKRVGVNSIMSSNSNLVFYTPYMDENLNVTIGGNTVNGNVKTYCYKVKRFANSTPQWFPRDPNNVNYGYSLHVKDNTITGLEEDNFAQVKIYPNPSTGEFNITFGNIKADNVKITLVDASGRIVKFFENIAVYPNMNHKIDVTSIQTGMYYCNIISDEFISTTPVVINN